VLLTTANCAKIQNLLLVDPETGLPARSQVRFG